MRRRRRALPCCPMRLGRYLVAGLAALVLMACGPDESATGAEIYSQVCARCHGADLSGGVGPDLGPGSSAAAQTDEFLVQTISDGRGRMPSFRQTLSAAQIERVVRFLRQRQGQS